MKAVRVSRVDLEYAFESGRLDYLAFLDVETGEVLIIPEHAFVELYELDEDDIELLSDVEREDIQTADRVEGDPQHYRRLPEQDSRVGYRDMQEYIWSLDEGTLRHQLERAIEGRGAFRRFKDVLHDHPTARAAWQVFQAARLDRRIRSWFEAEGLEPEFV